MKTNDTRPEGRRQQRGGRRYDNRKDRPRENREPRAGTPKKASFWQKLLAFFTGGKKDGKAAHAQKNRDDRNNGRQPENSDRSRREARKPEHVEVTSPKLFVGNLSYDATESDLFDLFNGVGEVQNAEVVTDKDGYRSKGFAFVTMLTIDEAKRAVDTLHDKAFMGRKLVVSGSKSEGPRM